jgi:hypothetical protein
VFQVRDPVVASFVFCRAMRRVVAPAMPVVPAVATPAAGTPFFGLRTGIPARSPAAPAALRARPAPEAPFLGFGAKAGATPAVPEAPTKAALEAALELAREAGTEAAPEAAPEAPAKRTSASAPMAEEEGPGEERRMHRTPPPGERPPAPAVFVLVVVVMTMLVLVVFVMTMLVLVVFVMTVRFPPGLLVSLAAPRAAPSLCFEIVVIIFS